MPALSLSENLDDVLVEANRTHYGLGGSVWTSNLERGEQLVQQIESGTGWVNQHMDITPFAPFGGCKWAASATKTASGATRSSPKCRW